MAAPPTARELWDAANRTGLGFVEWDEDHDPADEMIEGFAIPGRWTAAVAGAKVGKSILLIYASVEVSEGRDPWTGEEQEPLDVIYIDSEMGRIDIAERLNDCGHDPRKLGRWHACDLPPRLDTPEGGSKVMVSVADRAARLVVIDGLNGVVSGAEKDDTPWRNLYEHTIRPLKDAGVAVVSADNLGKDETLGPRGSSVKLDKADAVIRITRTNNGVALRATHRRTAAYPAETALEVTGLDGTEPVRYRIQGGAVWPAGTKRAVALLDELAVPVEFGRDKVRRLLAEAAAADPDRWRVENVVLSAAIRWRKRYGCTTISVRTDSAKPLVDGPDRSVVDNPADKTSGQVQSNPSEQGGQAPRTGADRSPSLEDGGRLSSETDSPPSRPRNPPDPG